MPYIESELHTTFLPEKNNNEYLLTFKVNGYEFANALPADIVKDVMASQLKTYLTFAVGELLQKPEIKEMMLPKIKEHMESMTLAEILSETGNNLADISWLWKEE